MQTIVIDRNEFQMAPAENVSSTLPVIHCGLDSKHKTKKLVSVDTDIDIT